MAPSRYAPLVKLKKQGLDEAERSLVAANNEVAGASESLSLAYRTLETLSIPMQGSVQELVQANRLMQAQHETILLCRERLMSAQMNQVRKREAFNRAMMEYEKFKYLEVQEVNAKMKRLKEIESKMLDEIGTMTYRRELA